MSRLEEDERDPLRSLSVGFLSMLPLFGAYEWSVHAVDGRVRNASEAFVSVPLRIFGGVHDELRLGLLVAVAVLCFSAVRLRGWTLGSPVMRILLEGAAAAVALGPLLLISTRLFLGAEAAVPLQAGDVAGPVRAAFVFGGAAYEELVFRVGIFSLVFLLVRRLFFARRFETATARWVSELAGLFVSAGAFAGIHLSVLAGFLGRGGEDFHPGLFAWRALAGVFLVVLFRWRGPGVAAWCHGLFNAALVIGAGPGVLT